MADCQNIGSCSFMKTYDSDPSKHLAVRGFVTSYCKGDKQNICIRKKISAALGSSAVPPNMIPSGMPLSGTSSADWPEKVKETARSAGVLFI